MPTESKLKSKITKGDPPPEGTPREYDWPAIAEQLKAEPGQWFKVFERDKTGYANSIRNGYIAALRDSVEVMTRNNTKGRPRTADDPGEPRMCQLWLRYVKPKRKAK